MRTLATVKQTGLMRGAAPPPSVKSILHRSVFSLPDRPSSRVNVRVSYTSQSGSESDRVHARYHKLHALVENGKPKWQRWATSIRLMDKFEQADDRANQMLWQVIQRLTAHNH